MEGLLCRLRQKLQSRHPGAEGGMWLGPVTTIDHHLTIATLRIATVSLPRQPRRAASLQARASALQSSAAAFRLRRATHADVDQIAALCLDVFGGDDAEEWYLPAGLARRPRTQAEWSGQLTAALERKAMAQRARLEWSRRRRLSSATTPAATGGRRAAARVAVVERQQLERWRRQRQFICLVAEERCSGAVVGCVAVTLARPEAALPPPFPTACQVRCYASNMAVQPAQRRRGAASALLARCEAVAAAWRYDSLWLHVDESNEGGTALYAGAGYDEQRRTPFLMFKRQRLLRKVIPLKPCPPMAAAAAVGVGRVGGSRQEDGVFIWDVDEGS